MSIRYRQLSESVSNRAELRQEFGAYLLNEMTPFEKELYGSSQEDEQVDNMVFEISIGIRRNLREKGYGILVRVQRKCSIMANVDM
ncbi:MAG: hypothetical protein J7M40_13620 [Planctomycetes bacterium]|nr:hypothetical protein [Planctomycetota bacterium]